MAGIKVNTYKIKVYNKEKNAYYSVTVNCNIVGGKGVVGAYGYSQYDVNWSGVRTTTPAYFETSDTMAVEVHNVSGYVPDYVTNGGRCTNISGPKSMSGGKYWTFNITGNATINVYYKSSVTTYSVSTSVGSGSGSLSGGGTYNSGASVTITATPSTNYALNYIVDEGTGGHVSNPYTFNIYSNKSFKAYFYKTKSVITTNVSPQGGGTTSGGGTINVGAQTTLIAYPNEGYIFDHWNIDGQLYYDPTVPYTVTERDITATAYFIYNKVTLTITEVPSEGGTTSGRGTYDKNTTVTMIAYANEGYIFDYWNIEGTRYYDTTQPIRLDKSYSVEAHFKEHFVTIELIDEPSNVGTLQQQQRGSSIWYGREHQWRPNTEITIGALDSYENLYKFSHWYSGERPSHYNRFQNYTTEVIGARIKATYVLKKKWTLNIIFAGAYEQSDLYFNIITSVQGGLTKLNAVTWLAYELISLNFDIQVRNPDYQIEKVEFDDWEHGWTTISTQGSFRWGVPEITDDRDHYGTIRVTVRPNTTKRRTIHVGVFPRDTLAKVELTHHYYDWNRQLWLFHIYTITASDVFDLTVNDGDKISLNAIGYREGTDIWAFDYWNGDLPQEGYKTVNQINNIVVGKDMRFYANFTYGLTFQTFVEPEEAGYIAIVPPAEQIDDNTWIIGLGQRLRMRAIGYTGYTFSHWTLDGTMGPDTDEYTIASMTSQDYHIFRAYFNGGVGPVDQFYLHVHANPTEGGIVTIDGEEVESVTKPRNTVVTIKAIPNLGYRFIGWVTGEKSDELNITMDQDKSYVALFTKTIEPTEDVDIISWWASKRKRKRKTIILK